MQKLFYTLIFIQLLLCQNVSGQYEININELKSNFAKGENKEKYYTKLIKNIEVTFNTDIKKNNAQWLKALRDAQSIFLDNDIVVKGMKTALSLPVDFNLKFQRASIEIAYSLFANNFKEEVNKILLNTKDPVSFAIACNYMLNLQEYSRKELRKLLFDKFRDYKKKEVLRILEMDLDQIHQNSVLTRKDISTLLDHSFQNGKTIIYSFHRKNRMYPGLTIIKGPDGKFVKNKNGELFNIPQLALSFSNLPYYIPNGNTPQGIYSIIGWYISPTETIGPTPNILVRSPFEVSPEIFYHKKNKYNKWINDDYESLIPATLRDKHQLFQSYSAGKIGRRLIIIHGSTDETSYFNEHPYYPLTPTRGCLSSIEQWSPDNGQCLKSDQARLVNAFRSTKQKKGFLVVIELDDQRKKVEISEIEEILKVSPQR